MIRARCTRLRSLNRPRSGTEPATGSSGTGPSALVVIGSGAVTRERTALPRVGAVLAVARTGRRRVEVAATAVVVLLVPAVDLALEVLDVRHVRDLQLAALAGRLDDERTAVEDALDDAVAERHVVHARERHVTALARDQ